MGSSVEIRAQIDTETVRGLQLMNGGSAAALTAMLPAILQNPGLRRLAIWMIGAICCAGIGLAASIFHNRLRRKCSLQYDLAPSERESPHTSSILRRFATVPREPRVCTRSIIWMWTSFAMFLCAVLTVAVGGWLVVRENVPATFPCWDLKEVAGHPVRFNSCSGVISTGDFTSSGVTAHPILDPKDHTSPKSTLPPFPVSVTPNQGAPSDLVEGKLVRKGAPSDEYRSMIGTLVTSDWFWLMWQFIAVALSFLLIVRQVRHMRQANMLQALVSLDARWKSEEFYGYRVSACRRYGDGSLYVARREGEVLSFFEGLGAYLKRGIFDREILWDKYSYHVECYWFIFKQHVAEFRNSSRDVSWFDNFEYLDSQMKKCAEKRGLRNYGEKTQEEMSRFISGETELAFGPPIKATT